ncbi:3'-5' RNA helicase YTHDC2-like [Sitodiplosis mosellana]|uniref:3'-5' RNA helicase YTHDC2-like n=1 Tax=Sitodiplosis mosellana TaxID=263140 RepID=UPI002444C939|nr:3'-5' RNA helicase YTHDC2-like [Sitodiplosis mosellana]
MTRTGECLPVYQHREEIMRKINENQLVVISGETGSGKTTQVPQLILEYCYKWQEKCRIILTQPRRIAATSIAKRISEEWNEVHGTTVGHQIRCDSCFSKDTNLVLTTSGYLLRCMTSSKDACKEVTHLILDEVHERELNTDLLLITIRDAIKADPDIKVILMSATLDAAKFSHYFDDCPIINVPGRLYYVEIYQLASVLIKTNFPIGLNNNTQCIGLSTSAKNELVLEAYMKTIDPKKDMDHALITHVIAHIHSTGEDGNILVFLAGYQDIVQQAEIEVGGGSEVFNSMPRGVRKIILSTNIAETSITIDDVLYVIDVGKVKQKTYDKVNESTCLMTKTISQDCGKQRAGRAGRIRHGYCYRLYSDAEYTAMEQYSLPEICRISMTDVCLKSKMLDSNLPIERFLLKAIQPPSKTQIEHDINRLQNINALCSNRNITTLGYQLAHMPVDCFLGIAILHAIIFRCFQPVLVIVSALSLNDPFLLPTDNSVSIDKIGKEFSENSFSDHQMFYNVWFGWSQSSNRQQFCAENSICNSKMEMIDGVQQIIKRHLKMARFDEENANENAMNWALIKACLMAGLYPNVCRIDKNLVVSKQSIVIPHQSSTLSKRVNGQLGTDEAVFQMSKWLVYGEECCIENHQFIRNNTLIPSMNLILFTGQTNLQCDVRNNMDEQEHAFCRLNIDNWVMFTIDKKYAQLIGELRSKFVAIFSKFLQNPCEQRTTDEMKILNVLITMVEEDSIEATIKSKKTMALNMNL